MTTPGLQSTIPIIKPWIGEEEVEAAAAAIRSGWIAQGPNVAALEAEFATLVGAQHAVAVSNCTTALHLALIGTGIRHGDDVVVPSFSFIATTNAVLHAAANPVFCDVDETTGNATADTVTAALTPATKAVIVVDQGGMPADVDAIRAVCDERGIKIVQDAACAIGSTYRGDLVGARSPFVAFSFHPRKLVTSGEGGMLTVDDERVAVRLRQLREHGMSVSAADRHSTDKIVFEQYLETGFNYRMTDIQAAIVRVQLGKLDQIIERRRTLASRYQCAISKITGLRSVADPPYGTSNFQSFWVAVDDRYGVGRDELMSRFLDVAVSTRRGIMAAHLEPACERFTTGPLPVTEHLTANTIILPLYHDLTEADQDRVIAVLESCAR